MISNNIITKTDSYKHSHYQVLPEGTKTVYSYLESRKGMYPYDLFFGMQAYLMKYLTKPFTKKDIDIAERRVNQHIPELKFNRKGWEHILNKHGGYLPLRIRAVQEGLKIPLRMPLVTVQNTDPAVPWLTGHIETTLLRGIWYPTTVATRSNWIRGILAEALKKSSDTTSPMEKLNFMLHDFGMRGNTCEESAGISGAAHLVNFMGTDTMDALDWVETYYSEECAGYSIPATEHSVMTIYGRRNEIEAYRTAIRKFAKKGAIFATVADSYDIFEVCRSIMPQLKDDIVASGATMVLRPDSGDPMSVLPKMLELLEPIFGVTYNSKGYKVLNHIRLIWGDGINQDSVKAIVELLNQLGYSVDNIAFGCGGWMVQDLTRDTQGFAMKAAAALVDGTHIELCKDPVTDPGKRSKAGMVTTYQNGDGQYYSGLWIEGTDDALQDVYLDGELLNTTTMAAVRERADMGAF
jgi:Nicotinic acid phosphoribosyltransferase